MAKNECTTHLAGHFWTTAPTHIAVIMATNDGTIIPCRSFLAANNGTTTPCRASYNVAAAGGGAIAHGGTSKSFAVTGKP
eukprot:646639-Pelagomonas_calceolata.AAC.6